MTPQEMMRFSLQLREARRVAAEIERDEGGFADNAKGPPDEAFLFEREAGWESSLAPAA